MYRNFCTKPVRGIRGIFLRGIGNLFPRGKLFNKDFLELDFLELELPTSIASIPTPIPNSPIPNSPTLKIEYNSEKEVELL